MKLPLDHFRHLGIVNRWIGAHPANYNVGRKARTPRAIVVHIMAGTLAGTDAIFNTQRPIKSSTHYGIGRPWEQRKDERAALVIHQYVKESDTALHAGINPAKIVSGELQAPTWELWKPPSGQIRRKLVEEADPNLYTIGIEMEGTHTTPWTDKMYRPLAALIADICKRYAIPVNRRHIIGHREIDPSRRPNCPGLCDFSALIDRVKENHT